MNQCGMQRNALAACDEMRAPVFCPKPRRLAPVAVGESPRPFRWHSSQPLDCEAKAGADLLDIFQSRGGGGELSPVALPFFCGSPPSRPVTNPVIRDARFNEARPMANPVVRDARFIGASHIVAPPVLPLPLIDTGSPMSPRKSCARSKFSLTPAVVRIEGFNCDRRGSSSITAVA